MPSPKQIALGSIIFSIFIFLLWIFLNPFPIFQLEYNFIPIISNLDSYSVSFIIPLYIISSVFFNNAHRPINPMNKRFIKINKVILIGSITAILWFFINYLLFIPYVEYYLYSIISVNFISDLLFLLLFISSLIGLPLLCIIIVLPSDTIAAFKSLCKLFY